MRSTTSSAPCAPDWPVIPSAVVVANCDDVLMTSAAYDSPNVVWVAAGGGWAEDSVSCPRSGEIIVREQTHWYSTGTPSDVGPGGLRPSSVHSPTGGSTTRTSTDPTGCRCR